MTPTVARPRIGMTTTKRMLGAGVASIDASGLRAVLVPRIGFEPMISALRGRCPGPLDERGAGRADPRGTAAEERQKYKPRPEHAGTHAERRQCAAVDIRHCVI